MIRVGAFFLVAILLLESVPVAKSNPSTPISHVVVIMQENHTFDNYFGTYPGVNGINETAKIPIFPGSQFVIYPSHLNHTQRVLGLCNSWYCARNAYDNGSMDGFVSSSSPYAVGYYDGSDISYYWDYASQYVLMDNYFTSVMGPSLPNHLYMVAGQSGGIKSNINYKNATTIRFNFTTIMDELSRWGLSWKYYTTGPYQVNNENPLPGFDSYRNGAVFKRNVQWSDQFFNQLKRGGLANVTWVMPISNEISEHPPSDPSTGERWTVSIINSIMQSPYWNSTAIFVSWDDYGGWYDHVVPPQVDKYGYGFRVPCLIISPYARHGFVDHTLADHTSILKFIETVFSLPALASRDASASNLLEAFDFGKAPSHPMVLPGKFVPDHYPLVIAPQTTNTGEATGPASQRPGSLRALDPFASSILIGGVIGLLVLVAFQRHRRIVSREP